MLNETKIYQQFYWQSNLMDNALALFTVIYYMLQKMGGCEKAKGYFGLTYTINIYIQFNTIYYWLFVCLFFVCSKKKRAVIIMICSRKSKRKV